MSTEEALLRTIRDMPDEDTPRLMYADYLEEEGNVARAEFIRVQVERTQLPEGDAHRRELEDREHELLAEHECSWIGVNADDMDELENWRFDRGFIHEVSASPMWMRTTGADLCAANPLRRWRVTSGDRGVNFPEDLKEAGQRGWAARLESLDLTGWYSGLGELGGFFGSRSNFERLRDLNLIGRGPLEPLPDIIDFAPFRDQLTSLRFGNVGWEGGLDVPEFIRALGKTCKLQTLGVPGAMLLTDAASDLLRASALASLTSLDLSGNQIDAEASQVFRTAKFRLRELDLSGTPLGGTSLAQLLGFASLSELRTLRLNRCGNTASSIVALAASKFWGQAEELHLQTGTTYYAGEIDDAEVPAEPVAVSLTPLFTATGSKNLRVLDVSGNNLRDAGVAALCKAAWTESLTYLDLSQNYLSDAAIKEIAGCERFKKLRTLHLNFNSPYHLGGAATGDAITDVGLRALAESPNLANLRVLSLNGVRITSAGIEALLNSPHWQLSELRISQCQLRPNAISALVDSPRLSRLAYLDISSNDEIDLSDLEQLAESEYLSPMMELHARGLYAENTDVSNALRERLGRRFRA